MAYFGRTGADVPVAGDEDAALAFEKTACLTIDPLVLADSNSSSARCKSERLESAGG
jgi:hypothetical protein